MNKRQHIIIGTVVFAIYAFLLLQVRQIDIEIMIISYMILVVGLVMPDVLEPPDSWKHRGYGHSKRLLKNMALAFLICTLVTLLSQYFLLISSFFSGYIAHLLADSTTKVGLMD